MESEGNEKSIKHFENIIKVSDERFTPYEKILEIVKEGLNVYINYSKEIDQISKRFLENYFNEILMKISELNSSHEICNYLRQEKLKCTNIIIGYNIKKENMLGVDYQTSIDKIIEPLFVEYKRALEFEKIHPQPKIIIYKHSSEKQKSIEKIVPSEIITEEILVAKKTPPSIINPNFKLQDNFEQIICDGTEQEIMDDFMLLAKTKNRLNNEFFMKEEEVITFVKKNFSIYNVKPTGRYFEINLHFEQMTILKYFIYQFTVKYNRKIKLNKVKYALLLINNFDLFKNNNPIHLASNISESKKPKSPLDIIVIPKRKLS